MTRFDLPDPRHEAIGCVAILVALLAIAVCCAMLGDCGGWGVA